MGESVEATGTHEKPRGVFRRAPLLILTVVIVLVAIAMMHFFLDQIQDRVPAFDNALVTILTTAGLYLIALLILFCIAVRRWFAAPIRIIALLVCLTLLIAPFAMIRLVTDANLNVVGVRFVWAQAPDQRLAIPDASPVDLEEGQSFETTEYDFPGFLGPDRDASVEGVSLYPDWSQHAPEIVWKNPIGAGWSAFSIVGNRGYTMEQRGEFELLTCYDVDSGEIVWSHKEEARHDTRLGGIGPRSTPTVHDGKVFALGATGILVACDALTGQVAWRIELVPQNQEAITADQQNIAWGRAASALIYDGKLIVPWGDHEDSRVSLAALDPGTGDILWTGGEQQVSFSSPTLATLGGQPQIVIINESSIAGHNPETGEQLWLHDRKGKSNADANTTQPIVLPNDRILLTKGYGLGAELIEISRSDDDQWSVESLWSDRRLLKTKLSNAIAHDGYAYGLSDGILECIEIETATRKWRGGRYGHGQILRVGDHLVVSTEKGEVVLVKLDAEEFEELGRIAVIEGVTWNPLAISHDLLFVRNGEFAACVRLPLREEGDVVAELVGAQLDANEGQDANAEGSDVLATESDTP